MMYEQQPILFSPSRVQQAVNLARQALDQGQFAQAAKILAPFPTRLPAQFAAPVLEILGVCALSGVGRDWPGLMRRARTGYQLTADAAGAARVQERVALGHMARGEFTVAVKALEQAQADFANAGDARGQAGCTLTQARLSLRRGAFQAALRQSERAVQVYARLQDRNGEALARLSRAQVYAAMQQHGEAAPDLLWAERLVGADASRMTRVRLGLARAGVLVDLGHRRRAAVGLKMLEHAVETIGSMPLRADFARCMASALVSDDPTSARRYFEDARGLHERLGQRYHVAECELGLARAESRLGHMVGSRLDALRGFPLDTWPLLKTDWQLVRGMRPRATKDVLAPLDSEATVVTVKPPSGFVERVQALLGWVMGDDLGGSVPSDTTAPTPTSSEDWSGTGWGPMIQATPKASRKPRKKKQQQQEEEQVNYVSSIRSASLDMRV